MAAGGARPGSLDEAYEERERLKVAVEAAHAKLREAKRAGGPVEECFLETSRAEGRLSSLNAWIRKQHRLQNVPKPAPLPGGKSDLVPLLRECQTLTAERDRLQQWIDWLLQHADPACKCKVCVSLCRSKS